MAMFAAGFPVEVRSAKLEECCGRMHGDATGTFTCTAAPGVDM